MRRAFWLTKGCSNPPAKNSPRIRAKGRFGSRAIMPSTTEEDREAESATPKPITKAGSPLVKDLQEWEVESTKDGLDSSRNGYPF